MGSGPDLLVLTRAPLRLFYSVPLPLPFLKYTRAAARRARGEWEAAEAVDRLLFESTCSVNDLLAAFRTERAAKWLSVGSSPISC